MSNVCTIIEEYAEKYAERKLQDAEKRVEAETEKRFKSETIVNLLRLGSITAENIAKAVGAPIELVFALAKENGIEVV